MASASDKIPIPSPSKVLQPKEICISEEEYKAFNEISQRIDNEISNHIVNRDDGFALFSIDVDDLRLRQEAIDYYVKRTRESGWLCKYERRSMIRKTYGWTDGGSQDIVVGPHDFIVLVKVY